MKPYEREVVMPPGVRTQTVTALRGGVTSVKPDWVAEEVPVALVFNGISHAVMLASPDHLEDFALGFGLTEGLLADRSELYGIEIERDQRGISLQLEVAAACEWRLKERRRNLTGRTGCGLCGTESLDQVSRSVPMAPAVQLRSGALAHGQRALREWQVLQQLTGAAHAAAWCDLDGHIVVLREDIGRHNALDKLIGAMTLAQLDRTEGWVLVTSRASFEMVQKTAMSGAGVLAAVSAPTSLAVELAQRCGLALAGFVRGDDCVAYTHPQRFGLLQP
ncbi:formate dehydrogenase accessory sulfurtransferase FdhD [Hydrogenophaga sp. PAMC20947]|uniref:formate dehydrogenase accessory sulfurtransferase FdhD n=1 Tax=Hydrogenophaga sp. PAMC20947 TaxID=2565558 RepID=UPI00109DBEA1|nr:formate dehydrogenase accessory sulfurtransferase FdhD [Hydrogenophaga sp. PAMC20947]QCB46052.1 formate dehydrogenase accessory sulfurtransferase FdhD [Hydrogenophaga sp. PAMC20947]